METDSQDQSAPVEMSIDVRFGDTDPYGVIYCASYFRYCHHGIEEFLKRHGLLPSEVFRNRKEGYGLPIVHASCDFLKPVRYGDPLRLTVFITQMKEKALTFGFRFHRPGGNDIVATGEATMVAIGSDWRSRPFPDGVRRALLNSGRNSANHDL